MNTLSNFKTGAATAAPDAFETMVNWFGDLVNSMKKSAPRPNEISKYLENEIPVLITIIQLRLDSDQHLLPWMVALMAELPEGTFDFCSGDPFAEEQPEGCECHRCRVPFSTQTSFWKPELLRTAEEIAGYEDALAEISNYAGVN